MWFSATDGVYAGDRRPGDRAATSDEVAAWRASKVTLDQVQAECQRRIDLAVNLNQKLNLLGTMTAMLLGVTVLGQQPTAAQISDATLFVRAMQWIAEMKRACAGLVGNVAFDQDASWPTLADDLKVFGARY